MANSPSNDAMLNVLSDGHAIGETVSHAHQSARFTACSTSRRPAAGGATERSVGRRPGRHLEIEQTVSGIFVPKTIRSLEHSFTWWNFRSRDHSFPGTFVPWTVRSLELSFPGRPFVPYRCVSHSWRWIFTINKSMAVTARRRHQSASMSVSYFLHSTYNRIQPNNYLYTQIGLHFR